MSSINNNATAKAPRHKVKSKVVKVDPLARMMAAETQTVGKSFASAAGVVGNTKEVQFEATYFLDYKPKDVNTVMADSFDRTQSFMGDNQSLSRVDEVEVYVLPRFVNGENALTTFSVLFGVLGSIINSTATAVQYQLAAVRNTIVNPTANVHWTKVGSYKASKVFGNTNLAPNGRDNDQELYRLAIIDPDSGSVGTDQPYQLMVKLKYSQVLPIDLDIRVGNGYVDDWKNPSFTAPKDHYAVVQPKRLANTS